MDGFGQLPGPLGAAAEFAQDAPGLQLGVGSFAVQIAKAFGAEVTGVCSTAKADAVRALGADHIIDYTTADITDGEHHYEVILDIGGNRQLSHLRRILTARGRLVIERFSSSDFRTRTIARWFWLARRSNAAADTRQPGPTPMAMSSACSR